MAIRGSVSRFSSLLGELTPIGSEFTWLEIASKIVDRYLLDAGLPSDILANIEEHLAAHYVEMQASASGAATAGRVAKSERIGDYSISYGSDDDIASLNSTRNGQIAMALDSSGRLAEMNKPKPAFAVL